jgi:hypothetical protein
MTLNPNYNAQEFATTYIRKQEYMINQNIAGKKEHI